MYVTSQLYFVSSQADSSLYIRNSSASQIILMIYVDDIVITGSSATEVDEVISQLNLQFSLKDLGSAQLFLGMEITQLNKGVLLNQKKYINDVLHRLSMDNASSVPTPMVVAPKLTATDGHSFTDVHLYRQAVVHFNISVLHDLILYTM